MADPAWPLNVSVYGPPDSVEAVWKLTDVPSPGTGKGNVVVAVIPDGNVPSETVGVTPVFVEALTWRLKLVLG